MRIRRKWGQPRKSRRAIPPSVTGRSGAVPTPPLRPAGVAMKPFALLQNLVRQGASRLQGVHNGAWELPVSCKLRLLGISPGLCRGGAATFQRPPCSDRHPISLAPFLPAWCWRHKSECWCQSDTRLPCSSSRPGLSLVSSPTSSVSNHAMISSRFLALRHGSVSWGARSPSSSRICRR